mgnify:CR=1 FL=1
MAARDTQQRHFLITRPHLLDIVDEDWMRDTLPDDGKHVHAFCGPLLLLSCCAEFEISLRSAIGFARHRRPPCRHPRLRLSLLPAVVPLPEGVVAPSDEQEELGTDKKAAKPAEQQREGWSELGLGVPVLSGPPQ